MTTCSVCELTHGDGQCPDCATREFWASKTAREQEWRRNGKAKADTEFRIKAVC